MASEQICALSFANLVANISGAWQSEDGVTRIVDTKRALKFRQIGNFLEIDFDDIVVDGFLFKTRILGTLLRRPDRNIDLYAFGPSLGNTVITLITSFLDENRVISFNESQFAGQVPVQIDGNQTLLSAAFSIQHDLLQADVEVAERHAALTASVETSSLPAPLPSDIICKLRFRDIPTDIDALLQADDGERLFPFQDVRAFVFKKLANLVNITLDAPIETPLGFFDPKIFAILTIENNRLFLNGTSPVLGLVKIRLITNPIDVYEVVSFDVAASAGRPTLPEIATTFNKAAAKFTPKV